MEIEIFESGTLKVEKITEIINYEDLFGLCAEIKCDDKQKSVPEHLILKICSLTKSVFASVWHGKKLLFKQTIGEGKQTLQDYAIKRLKDTAMSIISNDVLFDIRFRRKKRKEKSLPAIVKKTSIPRFNSVAILKVKDYKLILEGPRYTSEIISQVWPLINFLPTSIEKNMGRIEGDLIEKQKETEDVKDVFLATVSHELRTPLNGIVGMITMLRDAGPINDTQQRYLTILMECSHQLMNMMNNLLDFSKMASRRLVLIKGPMTIAKAVKDSSLMIEGKAESKKIKYTVDVQRNIPNLIGDGQRLTQILSNLLSNAVKFTENGSVSLKVYAEPIHDNSNPIMYINKWRITFEVRDTGIGIPKTDQESIFEIFNQSSNQSSVVARNGTGLGLAISKELCKMMGGDIEVYSEGIKGRGCTFKFHIVAEEEVKMDKIEKEHSQAISESRIMVVDDRPEYRMQLTDMLFNWGCKPIVVSSGEDALRYISHGMVFDIVIVDICMPYMSGIELAQEIKSQKSMANAYLVALSSVELSSGIELFDVYMNKPIDQNLLLPILIECSIKKKNIGSDVSVSENIVKRPKKERKNLKILIAEDDHNNSFTIKEMLKYLGFDPLKIVIVENGEKCVAEVKKNHYDVVLMDIVMPVMDGLEATKHIRQLNSRPYIIAVSAAVQSSDKQRCQKVGIDGYLPKPILKEKLEIVLSPLVK